jgi:predicted Zn-dependent protease
MRGLAILTCFGAVALFAQMAEKEAALGQQVMNEIARQSKLVETPAAINALAQSLTLQPPITLKVIDSDKLLANTLPGGIVYVSTAVLQSTTRVELAGILAHEIGHSIARHGAPVEGENFATMPLTYIGGPTGICSRFVEPGSLVPKTFEARSVVFEAEADALGSQYLQRAGYEAAELKPIFERIRPMPPAPRKAPTLLR